MRRQARDEAFPEATDHLSPVDVHESVPSVEAGNRMHRPLMPRGQLPACSQPMSPLIPALLYLSRTCEAAADIAVVDVRMTELMDEA